MENCGTNSTELDSEGNHLEEKSKKKIDRSYLPTSDA
jgi:hypothetical protein